MQRILIYINSILFMFFVFGCETGVVKNESKSKSILTVQNDSLKKIREIIDEKMMMIDTFYYYKDNIENKDSIKAILKDLLEDVASYPYCSYLNKKIKVSSDSKQNKKNTNNFGKTFCFNGSQSISFNYKRIYTEQEKDTMYSESKYTLIKIGVFVSYEEPLSEIDTLTFEIFGKYLYDVNDTLTKFDQLYRESNFDTLKKQSHVFRLPLKHGNGLYFTDTRALFTPVLFFYDSYKYARDICRASNFDYDIKVYSKNKNICISEPIIMGDE